MIKNLTLVMLVFISFGTKAQIQKGTLLIGGQISASKTVNNFNSPIYPVPQPYPYYQNEDSKYLNVGLNIGKAIRDNKIIGFNFNTAHLKQTFFYNPNETGVAKNNMNDAGVFYRRYKKIGKDFYFFGQSNALINFGKTQYNYTNSINNSTIKQTGASLSVTPGVAYALCKKLYLELSMQNLVAIQYATSNQQFTNPAIKTTKSENYSFSSTLNSGVLSNIGIGFRLMF